MILTINWRESDGADHTEVVLGDVKTVRKEPITLAQAETGSIQYVRDCVKPDDMVNSVYVEWDGDQWVNYICDESVNITLYSDNGELFKTVMMGE